MIVFVSAGFVLEDDDDENTQQQPAVTIHDVVSTNMGLTRIELIQTHAMHTYKFGQKQT